MLSNKLSHLFLPLFAILLAQLTLSLAQANGKADPVYSCIDGTDDSFINYGKNIGKFGSQDFTVAFMIKTEETLPYFDIVGNRVSISHDNFFSIRMTGNHRTLPAGQLVIELDQDNKGTNYASLSSNRTSLNNGLWYHIAVVRSGQTLTLYIDGKKNAETNLNGIANISTNNEFKIGRSLDRSVTGRFAPKACYSDLEVFNRALSADEITTVFVSAGQVLLLHFAS